MTRTDPRLSPDHFRARLFALAAADGRGVGQLAKAAGMAPDHWYQVLSGRRANPTVGTVGRMLAAMGKTWADLD